MGILREKSNSFTKKSELKNVNKPKSATDLPSENPKNNSKTNQASTYKEIITRINASNISGRGVESGLGISTHSDFKRYEQNRDLDRGKVDSSKYNLNTVYKHYGAREGSKSRYQNSSNNEYKQGLHSSSNYKFSHNDEY